MAITAGRIKREHFAHFINATPEDTTAVYERLGVGNDTLSRTKNMNVEKTQDVTGNNEITITKGDEEVDVTPYYARRGTKLFDLLMRLDDDDAELDQLLTDYVEVKIWEDSTGTILNTATKRECYIEITEVGGDTTGFQIPFNIHLRGAKVKGTWTPDGTGGGTFTPESGGTGAFSAFSSPISATSTRSRTTSTGEN